MIEHMVTILRSQPLWLFPLSYVVGGLIAMALFGRKFPYTEKGHFSILAGLAIAGLIIGLIQTYFSRDALWILGAAIPIALLPLLWYLQRRTEQQTNNKQDAS